MKISEIIQEFIPCEVCGNRAVKNFYFHVIVHKGTQPYVKCCECEQEYYSARAKEIITRVESSRMAKTQSGFVLQKQEYMHPLLKVLSHI